MELLWNTPGAQVAIPNTVTVHAYAGLSTTGMTASPRAPAVAICGVHCNMHGVHCNSNMTVSVPLYRLCYAHTMPNKQKAW
jgi:hypothetical protein